jgi:hypothetical protein
MYSKPSPATLPMPATARNGRKSGASLLPPVVNAAIGRATRLLTSITPPSVGSAPIIRAARADDSRAVEKHAAAISPPMIAVTPGWVVQQS